jgi:hypothetical protein
MYVHIDQQIFEKRPALGLLLGTFTLVFILLSQYLSLLCKTGSSAFWRSFFSGMVRAAQGHISCMSAGIGKSFSGREL